MNSLDLELEDLGMRAATLELYAEERNAPFWMRERDAEKAAQLRERQYLLLAGMRTCAAEGCRTLVAGSVFCPACESERNHASRLAKLCRNLPRVSETQKRIGVYFTLFLASVAAWCGLILLLLYLWRLIL